MGIGTEQTGFIDGKLGTRVFYRYSPASVAPVGSLVVCHGFAEHSGRYLHFVDYFNALGYHVLALDLRGHGRSDGRRGHVNRWSEYVDDLHRAVSAAKARSPELPTYLVCHSMGGLVGINYLIDHPTDVAGAVISAPMLALKLVVPGWKDSMARGMSKLWPTLAVPTDLPASHISRDIDVVNAYEADPLVFHKATTRWYTESQEAMKRAFAHARAFETPFLLAIGTGDKIIDVAGVDRWFDAVGGKNKTLKHYDGLYHEIFNEPEKETVFADVAEWLRGQRQG